MGHTMQIPNEIWEWAEESCEIDSEGPASFLRNQLIGAYRRHQEMRRNQETSRNQEMNNVETIRPSRHNSKGVHVACYNKMVDEMGDDVPNATPWEAQRNTQCPKCKKIISVGESIVITSWGVEV